VLFSHTHHNHRANVAIFEGKNYFKLNFGRHYVTRGDTYLYQAVQEELGMQQLFKMALWLFTKFMKVKIV
jgi:hypothetical protein